MKFNENLKYLRKQANLTQEQLAEKLNVSRQAVTKWESGEGLPDIENLKEIAYIFSVSTDSLIGDIECKRENKIKKKINDLDWVIFAWAIMIIGNIIMPISTVIDEIYQDKDITIISIFAMFFVSMMILAFIVKRYLKREQKIMDMTLTEKGRKIRKKEMIKRFSIIFVFTFAVSIIDNLPTIYDGTSIFINNILENTLIGIIITAIVGIYFYKKQEKEVKKLNEKK